MILGLTSVPASPTVEYPYGTLPNPATLEILGGHRDVHKVRRIDVVSVLPLMSTMSPHFGPLFWSCPRRAVDLQCCVENYFEGQESVEKMTLVK